MEGLLTCGRVAWKSASADRKADFAVTQCEALCPVIGDSQFVGCHGFACCFLDAFADGAAECDVGLCRAATNFLNRAADAALKNVLACLR